MLLFGFDTATVQCTESSTRIAEYEAAPEWNRDQSAERDWKEREYRRRHGRSSAQTDKMYPDLRCYSKKTGRVKGVLEE